MPDQPHLTPDPLADRLGRFTPEASGLDQAELLFRAGRASVRGRRLWPALSGLLAVTQVVTLAFMLTRSTGSPSTLPTVSGTSNIAEPEIVPPQSPKREPRIVQTWRPTGDPDAAPAAKIIDQLVATVTPLTARSDPLRMNDILSLRFD